MTKFSLKNKVALVTGGGSGIGKAISLTFAKQGATVHILDFNIEAATETVKEIEALQGKAQAHQCDVANKTNVDDIVKTITANGNIDILINNAGIAHVGNIEACEEADLDRLYNVNIKGVYNCIKSCLPALKETGNGVILNLASIASTVGINDRFAYSMTKGAVLTNKNLLFNMAQMRAWLENVDITDGKEVMLTPLPMYHIFSFTVNCLLFAEATISSAKS